MKSGERERQMDRYDRISLMESIESLIWERQGKARQGKGIEDAEVVESRKVEQSLHQNLNRRNRILSCGELQ
jgi:hypothetical protein